MVIAVMGSKARERERMQRGARVRKRCWGVEKVRAGGIEMEGGR